MKRRNFLSGLFVAPVALKARLAQLFACKPVEPCGAPLLGVLVHYKSARNQSLTSHQREFLQLMAEGKSLKDALGHPARNRLFFCSLPYGHKGPHMLLDLRT